MSPIAARSHALDASLQISLLGKLKLEICARPEPRAGLLILRGSGMPVREAPIRMAIEHELIGCDAPDAWLRHLERRRLPVSSLLFQGEQRSGAMRCCMVKGGKSRHSGVMPASLTTRPHFSISAGM